MVLLGWLRCSASKTSVHCRFWRCTAVYAWWKAGSVAMPPDLAEDLAFVKGRCEPASSCSKAAMNSFVGARYRCSASRCQPRNGISFATHPQHRRVRRPWPLLPRQSRIVDPHNRCNTSLPRLSTTKLLLQRRRQQQQQQQQHQKQQLSWG